MTTFAEYYRLKDLSRRSFLLSPERDSEILVDPDGDILKFLSPRMTLTTPKFAVYGDFGTGKSHILRHVEKQLAPRYKLHPVYTRLSGFGQRSTFGDLHIRVMTSLEADLLSSLPNVQDVATWLGSVSGLLPDAQIALKLLAAAEVPGGERAQLRAWLLGTGPTPRQAFKLGLSGLLFATAGPAELVRLWRLASEVSLHVRGARLLLLLDEAESFQSVQPDVQRAIGAALRELFDQDNQELGFVVGLNTPSLRAVDHPLLRSDVVSRLYGAELRIVPLGDPQRAESFIQALWRQLAQPGAPMLLSNDGLRYVASMLRELRGQVAADVRELTATPTPRDLLKVLDLIGQRALHQGLRPPLGEVEVGRCFQGRS